MEQHLLFFDIDGTLIDDDTKEIPDSAVRALHRAKENGHQIFLCTGRCKAIWPKDVLAIGFDGVVGGCGTQLFYHDEEIYHSVLPQELQQEIAEDLTRWHIDGVLEGPVESYFRKEVWMPEVKKIVQENGRISVECRKCWEDTQTFAFDKMALWFDESSDMASFKAKYEDRFDFILRDPTFYEVVPNRCSKGTGIEKMCIHTGVDRKYTIGFGDSTNDLPMLEYTQISVAMGSGNPDIFPVVDYVAPPVSEDGIEKALQHIGVI